MFNKWWTTKCHRVIVTYEYKMVTWLTDCSKGNKRVSATGNSGKCRKSLITDAEEDKDPLRENNLTHSFYFPSKSTPQNVTLMLIYEICRWLDSPSAAPYTSLLYLERVIVWQRNAWVKMTKTSQKYSKNALSLWGRGGGVTWLQDTTVTSFLR